MVGKYIADIRPMYISLFLIGCLQPDRNPATYLKGSFRFQWLRGHNYHNAKRFMSRISRRLEKKKRFRAWDYYTLGKLIHYTADAFTFAHNERFASSLSAHREYEQQLQRYFLRFLEEGPQLELNLSGSIMDTISEYHRQYDCHKIGLQTDAQYALTVCCCIFAILSMKQIFH